MGLLPMVDPVKRKAFLSRSVAAYTVLAVLTAVQAYAVYASLFFTWSTVTPNPYHAEYHSFAVRWAAASIVIGLLWTTVVIRLWRQ